jgi:hypothetical protein
MQTQPQEDFVRIEAEQRVSKLASVAHTTTFWEIVSNFTLTYPCDFSTLEIVVTGRTAEGAKVLFPRDPRVCRDLIEWAASRVYEWKYPLLGPTPHRITKSLLLD